MITTGRKLLDSEVWAIANGLRTAAERYDVIAEENKVDPEKATATEIRSSLMRQFQDQAAFARRLADLFEGAGDITVEE